MFNSNKTNREDAFKKKSGFHIIKADNSENGMVIMNKLQIGEMMVRMLRKTVSLLGIIINNIQMN